MQIGRGMAAKLCRDDHNVNHNQHSHGTLRRQRRSCAAASESYMPPRAVALRQCANKLTASAEITHITVAVRIVMPGDCCSHACHARSS